MNRHPPLRIFCSIALQKVLEGLAPIFAAEHEMELDATYGTSAKIMQRIEAGGRADVVLLTRGAIDTLIARETLIAESCVDIAQSRVGLAVRQGAAIPDISTKELFKQALLAAKGVAYSHPSSGGASGVHLAQMMQQMGIAGAINATAKYGYGTPVAEFVVRGEAEVAVQQVSELKLVGGIHIIPLPDELQSVTTFSGALAQGAHAIEAGRDLLSVLVSRRVVDVIIASGMEPLPVSQDKGMKSL
jgi:molybdate transport system substrate-binding protein